jgi:hypothetical protein
MLSILVVVSVVSLLSLVGVAFLVMKDGVLDKILSELVAFATGALLGAAFFAYDS